MKNLLLNILTLSLILYSSITVATCPDILKANQRLLDSNKVIDLCQQYKGKNILVVNTASQCGFTSQFVQLEQLYQNHKDKDFVVLGFPSNDFRQDRGDEKNTAQVCYTEYGVTFPMMAKSKVKGIGANPVFHEIYQQTGNQPKWNFYKFFIDKEGNVIATFPSKTSPDSIEITTLIKDFAH
ncbi:glutathione peroxidase [Vibrio sp. SS-MA-C1-2]|uniref:glutathione peroxidase n=1 Tax=Vibrio sp. SS-MA-C1-2 TaxID=2908646 RepID=UPI001F340EE1|nr:glutathione peroxidase [Vibrio sp. SS-MA-C1-2]UJF17538.1 glutathione peroxidase [Vibrio sp. SS-MA-C1-2]